MTIAAFSTSVGSVCFIAAVLWAGVMDLVTMTIRNHIVLLLLAAFAALAPLTGLDAVRIGSSVLASLGVLVCTLIFFSRGWIGGGDAKLATVATLWIGADQTLPFALCMALFGGILTLGILGFRTMPLPALCLGLPWINRLHATGTGIPYGVAIASAALFVFPHTIWMKVPS